MHNNKNKRNINFVELAAEEESRRRTRRDTPFTDEDLQKFDELIARIITENAVKVKLQKEEMEKTKQEEKKLKNSKKMKGEILPVFTCKDTPEIHENSF